MDFFRLFAIRLGLVEVEYSSSGLTVHSSWIFYHHIERLSYLLQEIIRIEATSIVHISKGAKIEWILVAIIVIHAIIPLHRLILILRIRISILESVSELRRRHISISINLLRLSVVVAASLSLISIRLRSILTAVWVSVITAIIESDLQSGALISSNIVTISINTDIKTTTCDLCSIVVAIDSQSTASIGDIEVVVITIDVDDHFAISDNESIVIAMDIQVGLFVFNIYSAVATGIIHFFYFYLLLALEV